MNDLAARKRLLLSRADLQRQLIGLERSRLCARCRPPVVFTGAQRWWLLGGAIIAGVLLVRKGEGLARWLPTLVAVGHILKS